MEWARWSALIAGIGAMVRLLPRAARWFVGLLIANVRLALVIRERDVLRETVNQLLSEREAIHRELTSGSDPSPASSPKSSASVSILTQTR
jgi:hypothetical protein